MHELELATLVAFVDGELDEEAAREVETALRERPESQAVVQKLRDSKAWLVDSFAAVMTEPVPERLLDSIGEPAGAAPGIEGRVTALTAPGKRVSHEGWVAPRHFFRRVTQLAAAVALLVAGATAGFLGADLRPQQPVAAIAAFGQTQIQVLYSALEHDRSGSVVRWHDARSGQSVGIVPVRTFYESQDGNYCREYRREVQKVQQTAVIHGVACRDSAGEWMVRYELIRGSHIDVSSRL